MSRSRKSRIYWKNGRAYADFRDFARWGGRQEALIGKDARTATKHVDEAMRLCAARMADLEEAKRLYPEGLPEFDPLDAIATFIGHHVVCLEKRRRRGRALDPDTVKKQKHQLIHAARFLASRDKHLLRDITTADVRAWLADLEANPPPPLVHRAGGRKGRLTDNTRGKYLFALNAMLRRAWREERIRENPIDRLDPDERPRQHNAVTPFLEVGDAALLLELARRRAGRGRNHTQHYVRLAVHLLTGGRGSEVLGLEKADVDLVENQIWFRSNATRQNVNKVRGTARRVPLWPQLRAILIDYLASPHAPRGLRLSDGKGCRRWLDSLGADLGWPLKRVRLKVFRVTYASARVQTLDGGAPVSDWTVQQEMGHGSMRMLHEVYVRIGSSRQRREQVEYPWPEWAPQFEPQLLKAIPGIPERWTRVLDALPPEGATATEWQESVNVPESTFYYIRDKLAARGLVLRDSRGRGSRFHRATPPPLAGHACEAVERLTHPGAAERSLSLVS
jgi:integrase